MVDGTAVWFGTAGFDVLALVDDGVELAVDVETTTVVVGCSGCGTRAVPKDRRWVTLRDVPAVRAGPVAQAHLALQIGVDPVRRTP